MRLKNKKTGEIRNAEDVIIENLKKNGSTLNAISIDEIRNEWEDYEESKEYWCISQWGGIVQRRRLIPIHDEDMEAEHKKIGNYFPSKEEAEKAVEKLKAWKRLKDKGFRFDLSPALGHCDDKKFDISIIGTMPAKWWYNDKVVDDIHYIFGGEE